MPNVQWMSYSFVRLYLFKCDVYVFNYIWIDPKRFLIIFICIWKWFLSLFVFMFSVYLVFHCLTMFCIEKQVSEFFAAQLTTRQSRNPSREFIQKLLATHSRLARDSLATRENFRDWNSRLAACSRLTRDSRKFSRLNLATRPVAKRPETAF